MAVLVTADPEKVTTKLRRAVELSVEVATYDDLANALTAHTGEETTAQASPWPGG